MILQARRNAARQNVEQQIVTLALLQLQLLLTSLLLGQVTEEAREDLGVADATKVERHPRRERLGLVGPTASTSSAKVALLE